MYLSVVKKVAVAAAGMVLLASLAGCGQNADTNKDGSLGGDYSNAGGFVKLSDGRSVMCVAYGNGGVSCDWDHAK